MTEERKWEEMNPDCLVNIFGRVGLQSRVQVIPLVCKPWQQAVGNPLCWEKLIIPPIFPGPRSQNELIKFVVNQSQGRATLVALPNGSDREALIYVSEELPALRTVMLSCGVCIEHGDIIPSLLVKWKNMESLYLGHIITCLKEILVLIHIHLPNFKILRLNGGELDGETASALVTQVPKLKGLIINDARLKKEYLLLILQGCKELEYLDVRNCYGFDEDDDEILRLSSGIKNFQCDGSKAVAPWDIFNDPVLIAEAMANIDINFDIFAAIESDDEADEYQWDWN